MTRFDSPTNNKFLSPLVSILTTSFNREDYIAETIESVLSSSFTDFELIIVDDCSSDSTVSIARKYETRDSRLKVYVNEKNLGDYPNRNRAASFAEGKYIKYLDSDDTVYPHGLQVMVESMEKFPNAGFGLASLPNKDQPFPLCISPSEIYKEHFNGFYHFNRAPGSAIIKREVFIKEGGFSGERMVGDLDLWLRLARKYYMVKFPMNLYWSRQHVRQELNTGYAKKNYPKRSRDLVTQALNDPLCPLAEEDVVSIKRQLVSNRRRNYLSRFSKKILFR